MNRRNWFGRALAVLTTLLWPVARLLGQQTDREAPQQATLQDRLKSSLLCRRKEEFDYVALVVQEVDQGRLPVAVVLSTMKWAIKQRPHFPFYYFQFALRRRAAPYGVSL